ncbi:type IV secretory system conjugative DNA transfer family protein [Bombiscardovia coagulans]|uniref:Cell division protein FtsK n=1 Tax=Bombiscardovia coagulans TaxID=686666 RepID=A0A261ESN2_9BIFI|nr:hypothetical protein [Bombiscardovia coagulans]OZG49864.1 cell division protein FtsK [Bombiscardovia coagulans]
MGRTYKRQANRRTKQQTPVVVSYHTPIRIITIIVSILLIMFGLPGMLLNSIGFWFASVMARKPELTGFDAWRQPEPSSPREQRALHSYRKAKAWFARWQDFDPRSPIFMWTVGVGATFASLQYLFAWYTNTTNTLWMTWWSLTGTMIGTSLFLAAWIGAKHTSMTRTHCTFRPVKWTKSRSTQCLGFALAGILASLLVWALTGCWPFLVGLPCLLTPIPITHSWKAARSQFTADIESATMLDRWIQQVKKPSFRSRPMMVTQTQTSPSGERMFLISVSHPNEWVNQATRDDLRPYANSENLDLAFVFHGDDKLHALANIAPLQTPDPIALTSNKVSLMVRCNMETARLGFNYATWPGSSILLPVGYSDSKAAAFVWKIKGPQPDWMQVQSSWLRGSTDGELGDWGSLIGLHMIVDPSYTHGWVYRGEIENISFDDDKAARYRFQQFSTTTDTKHYLSLISNHERDLDTWDNALKTVKLPPPVAILYDNAERFETQDWALQVTPMGISQQGGFQATDYMSIDLRPAMGDSTIADVLGMPNATVRDSWYTRYFRFVQSVPAVNPRIPTVLRSVRGSSAAHALLAQVIASRAFASILKRPALVGKPEQMSNTDEWTLWRIPVELTGGVTPADARRAQPRLKSMMGADIALWQWLDASHVILWAGNQCPTQTNQWRYPQCAKQAVKLLLDDAWAQAGATTKDGRSITTISYAPAKGTLKKAVFTIPAGLPPDKVESCVDGFCSNAGFSYSKTLPSAQAGQSIMLVSERMPLPEYVEANWNTITGESLQLPFGVLDDGSTAVWNPHDTPHLLASGTTGSGKSSVSLTLVQAALRQGIQVAVTDPNKGANDFRPIRDKLIAFEDTLEGCCALTSWAVSQMRYRVQLITEHGGGDYDSLPEAIKPPRLLIQIDEFNSLLVKDKSKTANPLGDPEIDNQNTLTDWSNGIRTKIGFNVSTLLTQARSAGIMLLLGAQQLNAGDLDLLPQASTAKSMLGRIFLGNGNTAGNVSQNNVREANRLLRQSARNGGMPKGRGLYERMGRSVDMVQCWYSGQGEALAHSCSQLPDAKPVDLSSYMPAKPELVGVVTPADNDRVQVSLTSTTDDWILDD